MGRHIPYLMTTKISFLPAQLNIICVAEHFVHKCRSQA